jgi:hypothetical protein
MTARSIMTNRCDIERDLSAGESENPWGGDAQPQWTALHTDLPCRFWNDSVRTIMDSGKLVEITTRRMMVPAGTDVDEDCRVLSVRDRLGAELADGPMRIDGVMSRKGFVILIMVDAR